MCRSILLSKIAHQIWYDYPFSQRNRMTKRTVGMGLGGDRGVDGGGQHLKRVGEGYAIKGIFIK